MAAPEATFLHSRQPSRCCSLSDGICFATLLRRHFFSFAVFAVFIFPKSMGAALKQLQSSFLCIQRLNFHNVWPFSPVSTAIFFLLGLFLSVVVFRRRCVYLVDYVCYEAPPTFRIPSSSFLEYTNLMGCFNKESLEFYRNILERSGVGERTALPKAMHFLPPRPCLEYARDEAEMVMFGTLDTLFSGTKVQPQEIGILIVNCALFTPVPSLCSVIVNRYKMRGDVKSFNLSGMGCSAGIISISLANSLLRVYRSCYALIVTAEIISQNWYTGNRRSMLVPNCLFRIGAATILLSNKRQDANRSKYRLQNVVRTLNAKSDESYRCVYQEQDEEGHLGVSLSKHLTKVAGDALRTNITTLAPLVLPLYEQVAFVIVEVIRKLFNPNLRPYIPDFKRAIDHFCIHAGGRAVIDELGKSLNLSSEQVEASTMTLHRFANTSSSSIWYVLSYLEAKGKVRAGQRVWQIALGSGFKCNSCVWTALSSIGKSTWGNPWISCIAEYPRDNAVPFT